MKRQLGLLGVLVILVFCLLPLAALASASAGVVITASVYVGTVPWISTLAATNIYMDGSGTHGTLNGELMDLGNATTNDIWFEWGYDASCGNEVGKQTVNSTGNYSCTLSHYNPDATIHYRFVGESLGGVVYGSNYSFGMGYSHVLGVYRVTQVLPYIAIAGVILMVLLVAMGGVGLIPGIVLAAVVILVGLAFNNAIMGALGGMW